MTIDRPVAFAGSDEERRANRATHQFDPEEGRCWACDCREWGEVANYPCGVEPPREEVRYG